MFAVRQCYLLIVLLTLLLPAAAQAEHKGLIWKVEGQGNTVWVAGTLHFANESFYPLPAAMEHAFQEAEVLAVEADVTRTTPEDVQLITELAAYPPGETLSKNISPRILAAFKEAGLDLAPFEPLKPWYAIMTAISMKLGAMGYDPGLGLDVHMIQRAHETGKPVEELESIQFQFKLMDRLAGMDENEFMRFMLQDLGKMESQLADMAGQWKTGDGAGMAQLLFAGMDSKPSLRPFYDGIYFDRNRGMAERVSAYLNAGKNALVLVGSGHLVGEGSVIQLLEEKGFQPVQQ